MAHEARDYPMALDHSFGDGTRTRERVTWQIGYARFLYGVRAR